MVAGAGDDQHVPAATEGPGDLHLRRGHVAGLGDRAHRRVVGHAALFSAGAGDGEVRNERDVLFAAGPQQLLAAIVEIDAVTVLDAHHRRDRLGLRQVRRPDVGQAQVPDQPRVAQFGQLPEVLGHRLQVVLAQVDHVEMVAAELAQVLLDLAAQFVGAGHRPAGFRLRADLGGNDQAGRVRVQRLLDEVVGPVPVHASPLGRVEAGGVDVVDSQLDGTPQQPDDPVAVGGGGKVEVAGAGQPLGAETDPVDGQVAEGPGAGRGRVDLRSLHSTNLAMAAELRNRSNAR